MTRSAETITAKATPSYGGDDVIAADKFRRVPHLLRNPLACILKGEWLANRHRDENDCQEASVHPKAHADDGPFAVCQRRPDRQASEKHQAANIKDLDRPSPVQPIARQKDAGRRRSGYQAWRRPDKAR